MKRDSAFSQKIKVLEKLFVSGYRTEKELQLISVENMLGIPGITIPDLNVIVELQKNTKTNRLFSYLGGTYNNNVPKS